MKGENQSYGSRGLLLAGALGLILPGCHLTDSLSSGEAPMDGQEFPAKVEVDELPKPERPVIRQKYGGAAIFKQITSQKNE